ncbi:MAG: TonB-dependent receptor [Bacteroides sp.]|nr:TonB-dependent receptor [Bacteroides sp.]
MRTTIINLCITCLLMLPPALYAQEGREITGRVTDAEQYGLPGANVRVKGTSTGTTTDIDGNYTLYVPDPEKAILIFSFIGLQPKEITIGHQRTIHVTLDASAIELEEVVKIGYATVKRKDLTGSVSSVNTRELAAAPITDVTQALSGKVAGVQIIRSQGSPDADISIRIRGGTSITQNNEPLYIIDGFPSEDGLKGIEAGDIESIDILKDASSTAIYGARGANGVVLVTTKGGKKEKLQISYDMYIGYKKVSKRYDLLSVEDFVKLDYERSIDQPDRMRNIIIPTYGTFDEYASLYGNRKGIDWQKEVFERHSAISQQHKFTLSGGNPTSQYLVTYTRNDDKAIWYGSGLKRDNFRMKFSQEASSWLTFSPQMNYVDESTRGMGSLQDGGAFSRMQHVIQYRPTIGKNGADTDLIVNDDDPVLLLEGASPMQSPIASIESETIEKRNRILTVNGDAEIRFTQELSYRGTVGIRKRMRNEDTFYGERSKQAKNAGAPYGWKTSLDEESLMYNHVVTYNKNLGTDHQLDLVGGQEYITSRSKYLKTGASNFPNKNFGLDDMSLGSTPDKPVTLNQEDRMLSYFLRANYQWRQKYLFAASLRADGSSKFGTENKWGYFPSASFAWRASEEEFIRRLGLFSNLKLRLSYGTAGNNRIDNYLSLSKIGSVWIPYGTGTQSGFVSKQLHNPNLKWETNITTNIGIDLGFLEQRLQLTVDLYHIETKDLLLNANVPLLSGYETTMINAGKTSNRGIEMSLTTHNIRTRDFSWSTDLNLSHNRNKVKALYMADYMEIVSGWAQTSEFNKSDYMIRVGEPLGQMYGYVLEGIYTTDHFTYDSESASYRLKPGIPYDESRYPKPGYWKFADLDGNGEITTEDRKVLGNASPKLYGGLNNTITWKGFDLNVFLNFSWGNKIYSANKMYYTKLNNQYRNTLTEANKRFTVINNQGEYIFHDPQQLAAVNQGRTFVSVEGSSDLYFHSGYVEDGSFLKINTVSLGYTLPRRLTEKVKLSAVRFYATGYNLHTFTRYSGYDPEVNTFPNSGLTPGIDWGAYPSARSMVFGAHIAF